MLKFDVPRKLSYGLLYIAAALIGAGLMFLSEPMIGKMLLPLFGGVPAVWNTCIVFFQILLLAGYAYAHWAPKFLGMKRHIWIHGALLLLPLMVLPFAMPGWSLTGTSELPIARILAILLVTIGGPFFILSTAGPLLQRWFANTKHPDARHPYFLYAASNLGSFVALISYPIFVEPNLTLKSQSTLWAAGYALFVAVTITCMIFMWRNRRSDTEDDLKVANDKTTSSTAKVTGRQRLRWLYWAFLPSTLLLGVTAHITTEIGAVPLLWIIPLALYLLTFVLTFALREPGRLVNRFAPAAAAALFGSFLFATFADLFTHTFGLIFYLAAFTIIAVVAHGLLASNKPDPKFLTEFYLWISIGGAAGGIFNSLAAPVIFNNLYELPLALLLCLPMLAFIKRIRTQSWPTLAAILVLMLLCMGFLLLRRYTPHDVNQATVLLTILLAGTYFLYVSRPVIVSVALTPLLILPIVYLATESTIFTDRTFYGVLKVKQEQGVRSLQHGSTLHGNQSTDDTKSKLPTTYYHPGGPFNDMVQLCRDISGCRNTAVIGLGTGTIAAYGRTGDTITFYEIDAGIAEIAENRRYFTYLSDTKASVRTVIGDGRLKVAQSKGGYDLIILDAFSSDSIPTHLLTREALKLYQSKLSEQGLIAVHISNRLLNLEPVVLAASKDQQLTGLVGLGEPKVPALGTPSHWVILAKDSKDLAKLRADGQWRPLSGREVRVWTDDFSNIFEAIK